jgi:hypothetical protein
MPQHQECLDNSGLPQITKSSIKSVFHPLSKVAKMVQKITTTTMRLNHQQTKNHSALRANHPATPSAQTLPVPDQEPVVAEPGAAAVPSLPNKHRAIATSHSSALRNPQSTPRRYVSSLSYPMSFATPGYIGIGIGWAESASFFESTSFSHAVVEGVGVS